LSAQFEVSFSSYHPGGCNMSLADGSTRFVGESIDLEAWRALASRNGREVVSAR
jgi:prepilin-type processing-associated H-X9-DG protein